MTFNVYRRNYNLSVITNILNAVLSPCQKRSKKIINNNHLSYVNLIFNDNKKQYLIFQKLDSYKIIKI